MELILGASGRSRSLVFATLLLGICPGMALSQGKSVTYFYTDPQGSVLATADAQGNVLQESDYRPFGSQTAHLAGSTPGYTGHARDDESGLVYAQQRYYDSDVGRFLSVDPVGVLQSGGKGFARYTYVNDNPYRYVDPDGRYSCKQAGDNCTRFEQGMVIARAATTSNRLSADQRASLKQVTDAIGSQNDGNNVVIDFNGDGAKGGLQNYDPKTGIVTLSIRPDRELRNMTLNTIHEGKHGLIDSSRGRNDASRHERLDNERAAYREQANIQQAMQYSRSSQDPWVYGKGIVESNIEEGAQRSVQIACGTETAGSCGN